MPRIHFRAVLIASLTVSCVLAALLANAQPMPPMPSPIVEFPVAGDPTGVTTGPDGNIWFTEQYARKIGRMTPGGVITEFPFPSSSVSPPFGRPFAITAGPDGNIWFTMIPLNSNDPWATGAGVGRITPTGTLTMFSCCNVPSGIAAGPDGNLWFIDLDIINGEPIAGSIGRITPTGSITTFRAELDSDVYYLPGAISAGSDGNLWFTAVALPSIGPLPGTWSSIGRITTTGNQTFFGLPSNFRQPPSPVPAYPAVYSGLVAGITSGPDGNLWFTESGFAGEPDQNAIGRITPAGTITEFPIPKVANANASAARPAAITTGPDGNLWFTEPDANKIGRVTTAGEFVEFAAATAATSNRSPTGFGPYFTNDLFSITSGPDGNVWFSEPIGQKIGRIAGTAAPGGNANLVWRQTQTGDLGLWSLSGLSIRSENQLAAGVSPVWQVSAVGDLDGNGTQDLVWRHTQTGDTGVWLMDGGTIMAVRAIALGVPLAWQIVGVADLNGDGKADLVWRNMQSGDLGVWFMDGATVKGEAPIALGVPLVWQIAGLADLDGDGKADIVWRNAQSGDVGAWLMNGAAVRSQSAIAFGVPGWWQIAGIADSNGDGKADLLWRSMQNGDVGLWLMNGTTIVDMRPISLGVPLEWRILKFMDVDGDGRADVVWRHDNPPPGGSVAGEVTIWMLDGATLKEWRVVRVTETISDGVAPVWQVQ